MKKSEIFKKLQNIDPIIAKGLKLSMEEIDYIKEKLLNDKLGLKLNFTEVDEKLEENYVLLKEIKKLHINPKDSKNHLIIEGDNYYALHAPQIAGVKVDIIYIDPPYNTGREFTYKDDYGITRKVGSDDPHRHSKWLSLCKEDSN